MAMWVPSQEDSAPGKVKYSFVYVHLIVSTETAGERENNGLNCMHCHQSLHAQLVSWLVRSRNLLQMSFLQHTL